MRTESQPIGRLIEQFLAAAFTAHPYGQPGRRLACRDLHDVLRHRRRRVLRAATTSRRTCGDASSAT